MINLRTVGGRRFVLAIGCGLMTTLLCWFGKIGGEVYAAVIIATVGAYIAGNVVSEVKGRPGADLGDA